MGLVIELKVATQEHNIIGTGVFILLFFLNKLSNNLMNNIIWISQIAMLCHTPPFHPFSYQNDLCHQICTEKFTRMNDVVGVKCLRYASSGTPEFFGLMYFLKQ